MNELFQLINQDQNNLNTSFQHAKQTIDDTFSFLVQTVHEAQKGLYTELEGIYGYKQVFFNFKSSELPPKQGRSYGSELAIALP